MLKILHSKKFLILGLIFIFFITTGQKCGGPPQGLTPGRPQPVTLNYWKVWEESSNMAELISLYKQINPHVNINYRNLTYDEFEYELLRVLADNDPSNDPDIFSIHTTWMQNYLDKIKPLPGQISLPYRVVRGTIKEEVFTEMRIKKTLTLTDLRNLFPEVVFQNQYINNQIYGLPLNIDSLALYSNRDLLNLAGITRPPRTWTEFQDQVIKLASQNTRGEIIQAGAALGTADNVERSVDILNLLMLQNGAQMTDSRNRIYFDQIPEGMSLNPAEQALNFYTSFASPAKQVYTWNNNMQNSLQAFINGKTAFFFGYAYHLPLIKAQGPNINFSVAEMPQTRDPETTPGFRKINYASYWVETVSNRSTNADQAWDFVLFMAAQKDNNKKYLDRSKKPAALKELISGQLDDYELGAFANQVLTAQSWYRGKNINQAEEIFKSIIRGNLQGVIPARQLILDAAKQLKSIY